MSELPELYKVTAYSCGSWEFGIIRACSKEEAYSIAKSLFIGYKIDIDEVEFENNYCYVTCRG